MRHFAFLILLAALFTVFETTSVKGADVPYSLASLPLFTRAHVNIFGNRSLKRKELPESAIKQFSILLRRLSVSEDHDVSGLSLPPNDYVFDLYNHEDHVGQLRISFSGGMIEFIKAKPGSANSFSGSGPQIFDVKSEQAQALKTFLKNQFPDNPIK